MIRRFPALAVALVRRLLSGDYADKVIVTTIQKLGLALDENNKRNQQRKKNDQPTYKELLAPLRDKRMAFIFDECHRSQFSEDHKAIKEFFPQAQLFGFHIDYFKVAGASSSRTASRREQDAPATLPKPGEGVAKRAIIEAILSKHDAATGGRRFNALLATASINDAIEYHGLFQSIQADIKRLFDTVFIKIKSKYNFVLHAPAPAPAPVRAPAPVAIP